MVVLFVSPVMRTSPQGREKQTYAYFGANGQLEFGPQKRQSRSETTVTRLMFTGDFQKQQYNTGLDEIVDNPYYGSLDTTIAETYKTSKTIKLQTLYELQEGFEIGTLHNRITNSMFNARLSKVDKDEASYIGVFHVDLYARANRFDDTTIRGKLAIQLLKNHPRVALNKESANPAIHHFYISEENEAIVEVRRKQDTIEQIMFEKVKLQNEASNFKTYQVASLCLYKDNRPAVVGEANHELVKAQLSAYLDSSSKFFNENSRKFLELITMIKDKKQSERFYVRYLLQQAINSNILDLRDGYIFWHSKANTPNMGKHTDILKLENLILSEMLIYNPQSDASNHYKDLLEECIKKGVRIE